MSKADLVALIATLEHVADRIAGRDEALRSSYIADALDVVDSATRAVVAATYPDDDTASSSARPVKW